MANQLSLFESQGNRISKALTVAPGWWTAENRFYRVARLAPLVEAGVEGFEACFEDLDDPRTGNAELHDLLEMLFAALCTFGGTNRSRHGDVCEGEGEVPSRVSQARARLTKP